MVDITQIDAQYFFADHTIKRRYDYPHYFIARDETAVEESDRAQRWSE